jgi:metal-sulfur cluster biosynthetic enzyme
VKITTELLDRPDVLASEAGEDNLRALQALYDVVDPELGINIVDLGLVYDVEASDDRVRVEMTMTTPACPLHAYLTQEVENALLGAGAHLVKVDLVWSPPWDPSLMSRDARQMLGY